MQNKLFNNFSNLKASGCRGHLCAPLDARPHQARSATLPIKHFNQSMIAAMN
jgi:hypothetical protein